MDDRTRDRTDDTDSSATSREQNRTAEVLAVYVIVSQELRRVESIKCVGVECIWNRAEAATRGEDFFECSVVTWVEFNLQVEVIGVEVDAAGHCYMCAEPDREEPTSHRHACRCVGPVFCPEQCTGSCCIVNFEAHVVASVCNSRSVNRTNFTLVVDDAVDTSRGFCDRNGEWRMENGECVGRHETCQQISAQYAHRDCATSTSPHSRAPPRVRLCYSQMMMALIVHREKR